MNPQPTLQQQQVQQVPAQPQVPNSARTYASSNQRPRGGRGNGNYNSNRNGNYLTQLNTQQGNYGGPKNGNSFNPQHYNRQQLQPPNFSRVYHGQNGYSNSLVPLPNPGPFPMASSPTYEENGFTNGLLPSPVLENSIPSINQTQRNWSAISTANSIHSALEQQQQQQQQSSIDVSIPTENGTNLNYSYPQMQQFQSQPSLGTTYYQVPFMPGPGGNGVYYLNGNSLCNPSSNGYGFVPHSPTTFFPTSYAGPTFPGAMGLPFQSHLLCSRCQNPIENQQGTDAEVQTEAEIKVSDNFPQ